MAKVSMRNQPKQFHKSDRKEFDPNGNYCYIGSNYCYASCSKRNGVVVELGGRNLSRKQLDHLIDWLERARKFRKFMKSKGAK